MSQRGIPTLHWTAQRDLCTHAFAASLTQSTLPPPPTSFLATALTQPAQLALVGFHRMTNTVRFRNGFVTGR